MALVSVIAFLFFYFLFWKGGIDLSNFVQDMYIKNYKHPWEKIKWYA